MATISKWQGFVHDRAETHVPWPLHSKKSVQSENQWQFLPFSSRSSSSPEGPWKPSFPLPLRWTWNFRKSQNFCSSSFQENLKVGSSQRRRNRLNYRQHSGEPRRKIREHVLLFARSWGFQKHPTFAWCLGTAGLWPWDAPTITHPRAHKTRAWRGYRLLVLNPKSTPGTVEWEFVSQQG